MQSWLIIIMLRNGVFTTAPEPRAGTVGTSWQIIPFVLHAFTSSFIP